MSLYWMDGFDNQDLSRWTLGGDPTIVSGRIGGYGVEMNSSSDRMVKTIPATQTLSYGFAAKIVSNVTHVLRVGPRDIGTTDGYCQIQADTGGWHVNHYIGSSGSQNTGSLGSSVRYGVWEHIEVAYVNGGAGVGSITIKFNGVTVYTYSGSTYYSSSAASMTDFTMFTSNNTINAVVDDVWVSSGELYGDCRVRGLFPTADVTKQWTASTGTDHYALVDENPPSMTDYVSATAGSALSDTFTLTVPSDIAVVSAVQVTAYGLKTDAGVAPLRVIADGQQSADLGLATTVGTVTGLFPTAASSAAWTPAKLASAGAVGIKAV